MLNIKESGVYDYIRCPIIYDLKHNKRVSINKNLSIKEILEIVAKYFFLNILDEKLLSIDKLKTKYDKLCENNDIDGKKGIEGLKLLYEFYNWACSSKIGIIAPATSYSIAINNSFISGVLSPIAVNKDGKLYFQVIDFSNRIHSQAYYDMRLKYTLDLIAYNNSATKEEINVVKIHHVKSNNDFATYRTREDIERAKISLKSITSCVTKELYYSRESVFCESCEYKSLCKFWTI